MKKLLAVLLMLALLVPATAAFAEEGKTTIKVWCWDPAFNIYAISEAAKVYNVENPNVEIIVDETASADVDTKVRVALSSGDTSTLPDIILCQDNNGRQFTSTFPDAFYDVTDKVALADFAQYKVKHFTRDDRVYGVPFDNGAAAMFLRTDYLEAAGLTMADVTDITWEQLIEVGLKVKEATGNYLLSAQAGYADFTSMMLQSANAWFFDAEGNPQLTAPVVKKAVESIVALRKSGIVKEGADWTEYIAGFNNGSAGGTIQGCWIIGSIVLSADQSGKWGMTNIPRLDIEGGTNYSSQGGSSWMVLASSPNAEIATDFLSKTFGGSVDFYQTILKSSGAIATYLPAAGGAAYAEPHEFFGGQKVFEDLMNYSASIPMVEYGVYNYEARDAIVVAVENVFNGGDIDAELQTAQETVEFLMAE